MPLFVFAALIMVEIDQLVKSWALNELKDLRTLPIIGDVFHLTYVENRGAAFSLFSQFDSRWIFVALACVITVVILVLLQKKVMQTQLGQWSLVLIAAGAVGNAIDSCDTRFCRGFIRFSSDPFSSIQCRGHLYLHGRRAFRPVCHVPAQRERRTAAERSCKAHRRGRTDNFGAGA